MTKIVKSADGKITTSLPGKPKSLREKLADHQQALKEQGPATPGRTIPVAEHEHLAVLLDDSGSMSEVVGPNGETKYEFLRKSIDSFANEINFMVTPVSTSRFNRPELIRTQDKSQLEYSAERARPAGGTPMERSLQEVIANDVRRAVLISDGDANHPDEAIAAAGQLAEQNKVCDCIHIGSSTRGEATLKTIAETTGGIFLKFTDVAAFAKGFSQLSPKGRKRLESASSKEIMLLTGASEVRK